MLTLNRRRAGFTLIELLVVVIIIGILAGIGVQNMGAAQDKARNSAILSGTRSLFLGVESWKADYPGQLPDDLLGGTDPSRYLAARTQAESASFTSKYVPGAMLPMTPWANAPQEAMDGTYNNNTMKTNPLVGENIKDGKALPMTNGYFADAGGSNGSPPDSGRGPSRRTHFGYFYYCGDPNSSRYAVFGVGKYKKEPRVFAVKANYQ